jgi:hypothetical protein
MQPGQGEWLTRIQDACSFYEHADGEARADLRTRPRNDLWAKLDARRTANCDGMPDGESGAPRFAIRYWSGRNWDEPNLFRIAHPSTIEQGGFIRVGGIKHQIEDGQNGFLVDSSGEAAERIVRLVKDQLRERLGERARETVRRRFLIPRLLEDWLDLITSFEAHFLLARGR